MQSIIPVFLLTVLASSSRLAGQVPLPDEPFPHDTEHPAAGTWVGNLNVAGSWRYVNLRLERSADAGWSGTGIIASFLALGANVSDIAMEGRRAAFTVQGQAATARFEGAVSADGGRITGTAIVSGPGADGLQAPFELARTVETMTLSRAVAFTGTTELQGLMKVDMTLAFAPTPAGNWIGHIDIPAQMTHGFLLAEIKSEDGKAFTATMPGPMPAQLALRLDEEQRRLTGTMTQGPYTLQIDLPRHDGYVGSTIRRPQHPVPPYPYRAQDVTVSHPDGHTLAGTLTLPAPATGPPPYAAAVLVTGSGAQDRDESLLGHKPFLVLADALTRAGIAVLRYDDRGYGASTGSFGAATSADFATDATAAVAFLRQREEINGDRIGVIGHSEGGLIAPMVARHDPRLAYIVLLAGPGVPGEDVLLLQAAKIRESAGADEAAIEVGREHQQAIFTALRCGREDNTLRATLRPIVKAAIQAETDSDDATIDQAVDAQLGQILSPWFRYFLDHDPREDLAAVRCPVLAVNGTLDLQVWHEQNLPEIRRVLEGAGVDVTTRAYDGLNHLFQPATTGSISEYAMIETTMDDVVLIDIAAWIREKTD